MNVTHAGTQALPTLPPDPVSKRRALNIRGNITQLKMTVSTNTSCR